MYFSVVIPTYNRADLLRETLDSIFAQSFTDYEVIVVDDGSTDGTESVIQSYGDRIRFLRQQNLGPGAARNLGLRHSTGHYVAFLDSDDLWFPGSLETYRQVIEKTGQPAFVAGKPHLFTAPGELINITQELPLSFLEYKDYFQSGDEWRWWGASSFVLRRDVLLAVNGCTEQPVTCDDADLALKLGAAPGFVQIKAPATFAYRRHPNNVTKQVSRLYANGHFLIREERAGRYPGGLQRRKERLAVLTRHIRPLLANPKSGWALHQAACLYWKTFWWHVELRRWKCLLGFPVKAVIGWGRSLAASNRPV